MKKRAVDSPSSLNDPDYSYVTVYQSDLTYAAEQGTISAKQATALWPVLEDRAEQRYAATLTWIAYYSGALLIISSMVWFTSVAYNNPHSLALFWLGLAYVGAFGYAAEYFWNRSSISYGKIVGGLFATVSVSVSPVVTFAFYRYIGYVSNEYPGLPEQLTVIVTGIIAVYFIPYPLLTAPISIGFWAFSQSTLVTIIYGLETTPADRATVSILFGFLEIIFAYIVQRANTKLDFSFFIYFFGLVSFWGALTYDWDQVFPTSQYFAWGYFFVNIILMGLAVPLNRILFLVFGGAGFAGFIVKELFIYGNIASNSWFAVLSGSSLVVAAYIVDKRDENSDFPFWAYLFGVGTLECGLSFLFGYPVYSSQLFKLFYLCANVGIALLYIPTQRDIFVFCGSVGVMWYAEELVEMYAPDYVLPIILTVLGLALIGIAVYLSTHKWLHARFGKRSAKKAIITEGDSQL